MVDEQATANEQPMATHEEHLPLFAPPHGRSMTFLVGLVAFEAAWFGFIAYVVVRYLA